MAKQTVYLPSLNEYRELPLAGVSRERAEDVRPAPQVSSREDFGVVRNKMSHFVPRARAWFGSFVPMVGESDGETGMGHGFVRVAASSRTYVAEY